MQFPDGQREIAGEKFREGRMEVALSLIEQVYFYSFSRLNGDSHRYKGSNIGIKKNSRIVLSAEVFLN